MSPPSFSPETSICKELCKRHWTNSVPVQQLFYHWSATGSLSTLWSSQESISSPALEFLIHFLWSLSCIAEAFPTLLWRGKNLVSLFIHKVLSESKSSSEDKTKNLPRQCTTLFFRETFYYWCSPWKREVRERQHYSTEETWPFLISASSLGKLTDKQLSPRSADKWPKPHGSLYCALSKSHQHRWLCGMLQWSFALQARLHHNSSYHSTQLWLATCLPMLFEGPWGSVSPSITSPSH